ncbi:hypothetical protein JCM24511_09347 [Saitozyma sp. JCM 24511]|nr:hypothetical protein JCM24511_09347 [Saitozyma sp. JCM 24511]
MTLVEKEILSLRTTLDATRKELEAVRLQQDRTPSGARRPASRDGGASTPLDSSRSDNKIDEEETGSDDEELELELNGLDGDGSEAEGDEEHDDDLVHIEGIRLHKRRRAGVGSNGRKKARTETLRGTEEGGVNSELEKVAFDIFGKRCANLMSFVDSRSSLDFEKMRASDSLFYWAIIAVGTREAVELSSIYTYARRRAITLARETLFGRRPTMEDLCGLIIMWTWLSDMWSPGHIVSLIHELGVGEVCSKLFHAWRDHRYSQADPFPAEARLREALRIVSMVSGRSRLLSNHTFVEQCRFLISGPDPPLSDIRTVAQVEVADIMAWAQSAVAHYEEVRPAYSDGIIRTMSEYNRALDDWHDKWKHMVAGSTRFHHNSPRESEGSVRFERSLQYIRHVTKIAVNCLPLRGVKTAADITPERTTFVRIAVEHARALARCVAEHYQPPGINYTSNVTQLQITHAAVLLIRITRILGGDYDDAAIVEEVRGLADTLANVSGKYYADRIYAILNHQSDKSVAQVGATEGITATAGLAPMLFNDMLGDLDDDLFAFTSFVQEQGDLDSLFTNWQ